MRAATAGRHAPTDSLLIRSSRDGSTMGAARGEVAPCRRFGRCRQGKPRNSAHIESVVKGVSVPVQVGGGIRSIETIRRYFSLGAQRVVIGTAALLNPVLLQRACAEFPDRILAGIDARDGKVAIRGWTSVSNTTAIELLPTLRGYSLAGVIYTDSAKTACWPGPCDGAPRDRGAFARHRHRLGRDHAPRRSPSHQVSGTADRRCDHREGAL